MLGRGEGGLDQVERGVRSIGSSGWRGIGENRSN